MKRTLTSSFLALTCGACLLPSATLAQLVISEVHPTGSSSTTYARDWFELKNNSLSTFNLTGWRVDDNSAAFTNALTLRGVASLAPGQIGVFMESDAAGAGDGTNGVAFTSAWFGSSVPSGFTLGYYGGAGIGLGSGGDGVNIYDSGGTLMAGITFGAATLGVTLDNAAGSSGVISQQSVLGVNGAFGSLAGSELGSPGVVPEPSVWALLGLAASALIALRPLNRRRSDSSTR